MTASTDGKLSGVRYHHFGLIAVCFAALLIRFWGIEWPSLHPDEYKITAWMEFRRDHAHIEDCFYAEGFFTLIKPLYALNFWLDEKIDRWSYFTRAADTPAIKERHALIFARKFNVWLAVINIVLVYLLISGVTGSPGAGLFGGALLAFAPLHVENSHYATTDIATLLMLTLALLLWLRVLKMGEWWRFGLAAFVTGFAIGTKLTLLMLFFCALVVSWIPAPGELRKNPGTGICRTIAAILLCAAGFVAANPGILEWNWFYPEICRSFNCVYAERDVLLGEAQDRWMPVLVNWKQFQVNWGLMGWAWIALIVAGFFVSLRRPYRAFWPVTLVFPVMFLFYFVFLAPWVRNQEFMLFSSSFALLAGMGIVAIAGLVAACSSRRLLKYLVCGFLAVWALGGVAVSGMRRASLFAWQDPRTLAREWLDIHAPEDRLIGFSQYTDPAFRMSRGHARTIGEVERTPISEIRGTGVAYIVRNPSVHGRGTVNPLTNVRFPEYDKYWDAFTNGARRIWSWTTLEPPSFSFACAPIEYWGLIDETPAVSIDVPLFQPRLVVSGSREGIWPVGCSLGAVKMVEVTKYSRTMVVGGPDSPDRRVYVLLQTLERAAVAHVDGLGLSRRVEMAPYSAKVVALKKPWYVPRLSAYDTIKVAAEPQAHILSIPCYAEAFLDESAVLCALVQKGYPDVAVALVGSGIVSGAGADSLLPVFSAATSEKNWPLADKLAGSAENLIGKLRAAATNLPQMVQVSGRSGIYYDEHSRMKLAPVVVKPMKDPADSATDFKGTVSLPVCLAKGTYTLSFLAMFSGAEQKCAENIPVLVEVTGADAQEGYLSSTRMKAMRFDMHIAKEESVKVSITMPYQRDIVLKDVEVRWRFRDSVLAVEKELCSAMSRYDLARLPAEQSLQRISERETRLRGDPELTRLLLKALARAGRRDSDEWKDSLARLKELAPAYDFDEEQSLCPAGPSNPEFYPYFRIAGTKHDPSKKRLECRFVVLRDEAPTPLIALWQRRLWPRGWRKINEFAISDRPMLFKGETIVVGLTLPDGAVAPFDGLFLSVRSNPDWVPDDYMVSGRTHTKIPVGDLLTQP